MALNQVLKMQHFNPDHQSRKELVTMIGQTNLMRMKDEDIENSLESKNTNNVEVKEKNSSREKMKEILSNRRNKKLRKNISLDQQILILNKEEMEIKREMLKKMELKTSSLAVLWRHFKKTCPTSRISFHSQHKWLHHLTLTLFSIDRLIIIKQHITNRQGVTVKVLLMLEK